MMQFLTNLWKSIVGEDNGIKEGRDYTILDSIASNILIQITSGDFKEVVFCIDWIGFEMIDLSSMKMPKISYNYHVVETPENLKPEWVEKNQEFITLTSNILDDMMSNHTIKIWSDHKEE